MGKQNLGVFSNTDPIDDPVLVASVQGAFYGCSLPSVRIEALIAAHVPRQHITDVADVYECRWWDYRRLAPGHSFFLFAHHYYKATKIAARRMVSERPRDARTTEGKKSAAIFGGSLIQMNPEEIWDRDQAHITGLWKAMLVADALGMPYGEFCRLGCRIAIDRLWKRLPRPSQLYSEKLGAYVLDEWITLSGQRLFAATHPLFAVENYADLPVQDEYRAWLIDAIKRAGDLITSLMTVVYTRPQLPEDVADLHFPAAALRRARLLAG